MDDDQSIGRNGHILHNGFSCQRGCIFLGEAGIRTDAGCLINPESNAIGTCLCYNQDIRKAGFSVGKSKKHPDLVDRHRSAMEVDHTGNPKPPFGLRSYQDHSLDKHRLSYRDCTRDPFNRKLQQGRRTASPDNPSLVLM